MVQKIVQTFHPQKIILFGSYAVGKAKKEAYKAAIQVKHFILDKIVG